MTRALYVAGNLVGAGLVCWITVAFLHISPIPGLIANVILAAALYPSRS